jgi:integrase
MVYVSAFTGLRASEMRGLPWSNVDLGAKFLKVTQRADAARRIGSPKSKAGYREIALAPEIARLLLLWKAECPPGQKNLVFPNWTGEGESINNIHNRGWYPLLKRAGVVDPRTGEGAYTWHSLRHFRASILIAGGATPKELMVEMGHSTIKLTFDTYGHLFPDTKAERMRRAADIAKSIIG